MLAGDCRRVRTEAVAGGLLLRWSEIRILKFEKKKAEFSLLHLKMNVVLQDPG